MLVPKTVVHFNGAKEDTIIIGVTSGLRKTVYRDASQPASAGTPIP